MYTSVQSSQPLQQPASVTTDQPYVRSSNGIKVQGVIAQNGSYMNDQVSVQQWYLSNGQPTNETCQLYSNQLAPQLVGQQTLHHQQQPILQQRYVTPNQGMQQCMPPQVPYEQQAHMLSQYIPANNTIPQPLMNQPVITSTPESAIVNNQIAQVAKRQIDDVSRSCDTSVNQQQTYQPPRHHDSRYVTPKKMKTVTISRQNNDKNLDSAISSGQENVKRIEVSSAACRFAATRYPFSPFLIFFETGVKDKLVIEELVKYAKDLNTELKIAAYRHKQVDKVYSILVFVEDIDSFCFLNVYANWPTLLCGETFGVKKPATPAQLCIVLPNVALSTDWEEFVQSMKEQYHDVSEVIRLKNHSQHPVRAVKVAFTSTESRNVVLQQKEMSIEHMKYRVVEYLSPAQVLICGNCCEIGHFQKNCTHRDETTCKTCGTRCSDIKNHECSGIPKCIRCGEDHRSADPKCRIVKSYRAALTQNLLQQPFVQSSGFVNTNPSQTEFPLFLAKHKQPFTCTTTNPTMEANVDSLISKKLDSFLAEIKEESQKTRETIDELREEMCKRDEETNKKIEGVEKKCQDLEIIFQEYTSMINHIMENLCRTMAKNVNMGEADAKYYMSEAQKFKTRSMRSKCTQ